jgi:hypothetical protein
MKILPILTVLLALLVPVIHSQGQSQALPIRGTLIHATNQHQGVDAPLRKYEGQLRRLNFTGFRAIGGGTTRLSIPGESEINLGKGFVVHIKAAPSSGPRPSVEVRWTEGRKTLIHTSGSLPLVLGGPRFQDGNLILVLDSQ